MNSPRAFSRWPFFIASIPAVNPPPLEPPLLKANHTPMMKRMTTAAAARTGSDNLGHRLRDSAAASACST
jgi:hypothetical protein